MLSYQSHFGYVELPESFCFYDIINIKKGSFRNPNL